MNRLTALIACALMACGGTANQPAPAGESPKPAAAPAPLVPFAGTLTVTHAERALRVKSSGLWSTLPQGASHADVQGLESESGAILDFAGSGRLGGRLWIQAGTKVRVGQDPRGQLTVDVEEGAARLTTFDAEAKDVLLTPNRSPLPTAQRPRAADWTTDMLSDPAPAGVGTMVPGDATTQLDLVALHVRATRNGDLADVVVEHRFYSHADAPIEGTFRFPLPSDAILTGLAMEIDGQLMEGELVEREKARKIYDDIVDQMQDPAILEWETGNVFKLRVFPIEPRVEKRVVLRYSVPLTDTDAGWAFEYATAAPAMRSTIGRFSVALDGRSVVDEKDYAPGATITVPVDQPAIAHVVERDGLTFTSVRVAPSWPAASAARRPRHVIVFVDTSRSALESQPLARQTVRAVLGALRPDDHFSLLSGDISVRHHGAGAPTSGAIEAAITALAEVRADGASDLGAALAQLAAEPIAEGHAGEVVYVGDGVATWGEADPDALKARAERLAMPFHSIALERDAETAFLARVAGATGGVAASPRSLRAVRRFATRLTTTTAGDRLDGVMVKVPAGYTLYPDAPMTFFRGDSVTITAMGPAPLRAVQLRGLAAGTPVTIDVPVPAPAPGGRADQRWATRYLAALQGDKDQKDAVVRESLRYGVMSRYTAFLVLESEEAYRQHDIERKKAKEAQALRIAGADLESDGAPQANLSHDHIQPGDPEVRVPAPADAQSVWVFFPFGDVHAATWEPELGLWTTRFLISKETPDGLYWIRVRVTHADGRVELIKLRYVVDTLKPEVELKLTRRRGKVRIEARQIVRAGELEREGLNTDDLAAAKQKYAHVAADLRRVDVRLPNGDILPLRAIATGHFRATWKPSEPLGDWLELTVVAHDKALNANPRTFTLDPNDRGWQLADEGVERE